MKTIDSSEISLLYKPVTSETRVEDFNIPTFITLGGSIVNIPESLRRKDPHFLIEANGSPKRVTWISKPLAHIFNSMRFENTNIRKRELGRALGAIDDYISKVVKYGVLRDKHGPGAMAFCQANENVPIDSILISSRTFETLCEQNHRWKYARTVMAVRFPNLGPGTTQELKLVINRETPTLHDIGESLSESSIGARCPSLKDLLDSFVEEEEQPLLESTGVCDAFYLHPDTLKNSFEGDGLVKLPL